MADPILQTKLYVPLARSNLVPRPGLIGKLNAGLRGKLTLFSAPAGFGKTTLAVDWLSQANRTFVWISLDEDDNDLARFFTYTAAAIQQIEGVGNSIQSLLESQQPVPLKPLATAFINDCSSISASFILIYEDFHTITEAPVNQAVAYLLDNLPSQLHLVITSRTDPMLPLSPCRARGGQMTELRTDDLRFTASETAVFLQELMGISLSDEEVSALAARTEGWIAGLQMAGLSMQGLKASEDIGDFVADFAGSHRYIFDYLTDEVLKHRPSGTQRFLLQSSILHRLSGPLCDAVTKDNDGQRILEQLDASNLFIVRLDNKRRWYRYHHLFADLLRHRLQTTYPDMVGQLHRRASVWYEDNDMPVEAIRHAMHGDDWHRAGRLVETNGREWLSRSQIGFLLRWLAPLPAWLIQARPNLGLLQGWAMALVNRFDQAESALQAAEAAFEAAMYQPEMWRNLAIALPDEQARFSGYLATCWAALARSHGDSQQVIAYTTQALEAFPENDLAGRGVAKLYLGYALWTSGDVPATRHAFDEARQNSRASNQLLTFVSAMDALGKILLELGELREAAELHQRALALAGSQPVQIRQQSFAGQKTPGVGLAHNGLAEVHYESNDLETATIYAATAISIFEPWGVTENLLDGYDVLARIRLAAGNVSSALALAHKAVSLVQDPNVPAWLQGVIFARQARLRIMADMIEPGQVKAVARWAEEAGLDQNDQISYQRELEYILLARLLRAQGQTDSALDLLNCLTQQADHGGRSGRLIEILNLKALLLDDVGNRHEVLSTLERSLMLAEPQGYLRIFVDEGPAMATLLAKAAIRDLAPRYVKQILQAFAAIPVPQSVVEMPQLHALSQREMEVLRLLPTGQTGPQIADQLYLSNNTIKTHIKNIYSKLDVNDRAGAIERARELGLIR